MCLGKHGKVIVSNLSHGICALVELMRLACAAAEKDILKFFEQWGMTPDADTIKYAGQFAKETRAIWYANDESRAYWLEKGTSSLNADGSTAAVGNVTAQVDADNRNQVKISLSNTLANPALAIKPVVLMLQNVLSRLPSCSILTGSRALGAE